MKSAWRGGICLCWEGRFEISRSHLSGFIEFVSHRLILIPTPTINALNKGLVNLHGVSNYDTKSQQVQR